jgi:hypothetical protein
MPMLQRTTKSKNGVFIYNNGHSVFINQPKIIDVAKLYEIIIANIKMIRTVFRNSYKKSTQTDH